MAANRLLFLFLFFSGQLFLYQRFGAGTEEIPQQASKPA